MSTEVTPESLHAHAEYAGEHGGAVTIVEGCLYRLADDLEREQRPLPTEPGWYQVVVERGGESCTGALLTDDKSWVTALGVDYSNYHDPDDQDVTIRWAEQDGTTPGQTLWEAEGNIGSWAKKLSIEAKDRGERYAAAVLAVHGTPTLADEDRAEEYHQGWVAGHKDVKPASLVLTPVGEYPEPGTRGLLPVVVGAAGEGWLYTLGEHDSYMCGVRGALSRTILADPRPDGAA